MVKLLEKIYYNFESPASFGGVRKLAEQARISQRKAKDWLMSQDVYTLHKPVRYRFPTRRTIALGPNELWQADLMDMKKYSRENKGIKYLLVVVDVFRRKLFVHALKNKTQEQVLEGFKTLFKREKCQKLHTDHGTEFFNRKLQSFFKSYGVHHYGTQSPNKASLAERKIRQIKEKIYRIFTHTSKYKYIDFLPALVKSINDSINRSTGFAPSKIKKIHHSTIFKKLYGSNANTKFKLNINDQVRISKTRKVFHKSYLPHWTHEIFLIKSRYKTQPPTYDLIDLKGEPLIGRFYEFELQRVTKPSNAFWKIEKILKSRGVGKRKQYLVQWHGFGPKFNSWIEATALKK